MRLLEAKKTNKKYTQYFHEDPTPAEKVGWSSIKDQTSRFTQFLKLEKVKPFSKASMIDVGCGFGHFLDFLKQKGKNVKSYLGIDINPNFIRKARKLHPESTFILGDFIDYKFREKFDFATASGIFNVKCAGKERAYEILYETVEKMLEASNKAVAFNFLSRKTVKNWTLTDEMQVYNKKRIIDWCRKKGAVEVIEGYDGFDTTIILEKSSKI